MAPHATKARDGDAGARIATALRTRIVTGDILPGSRIRQEDIAAEYGASRVPVREAIRQLEFEGLVTIVAKSGAWVSRLTLSECEEVYQMRERLEPLLLRYSAPNLDDAAMARLGELARRISEAGHDTETFLTLDREFHLASYAAAQSTQLASLVGQLWNTTAPYRRAYVASWSADARRIAYEEHHLMVAALRDDDIEDAERVLESHIRRTRRQLARNPHVFDPVTD